MTKKEKNEKKPLKSKNLKVLDHKGTLYATFDGVNYWKLEKYIYNLLKMCDGKTSFDQIVKSVAKQAGLRREDVKVALKPVFDEFEKDGFITYV